MRAPWLIDAWDRAGDLGARLASRRTAIAVAALAAGGAVAWLLVTGALDDGDEGPGTRVVTFEVIDEEEPEVGALGFPLVASRNTTRVGGADPVADAAAVALATHPPAESHPVEAVVLVPDEDWQAGVSASVLAGPPLRAPILVGSPDEIPEPTAATLDRLDPRGGSGAADAAVYRVGEVRSPEGLQAVDVAGSAPAEIAAGIDKLRRRLLGGEPEHVVIASEQDPAYAMPAAAWAARSGDPVLFSRRDELPEATAAALRRHRQARVYVLGPETVISDQALREVARAAPAVQRVGAEGPVANAIEFARYFDGSFGWNINDPGHGFIVANASRPLDAGAAAALSASGKWGPLLVIESARELPVDLRSFLLDVKPGFRDDPTRAVYNHLWLIGDTSAISAAVQAEIDVLAELVQVGTGAGGPVLESRGGGPDLALPGGAEDEPEPEPKRGRGAGR